ncbi:MAG: phasin family protein [Deltaproteobacteria bacterium]|jgi:polyhydroxyalkanoate synthesis regulator phasin|nr:phasin family protein [Deltaproteobacteria bacterium]
MARKQEVVAAAAVTDIVKDGITNVRDRFSRVEEESQRIARRLVEEVESRIPENQKKAVDEVLVFARRTREEIERRVDEGIDRTLGILNIPTRSQIEQLDDRLSELARRVNALQKTRKVQAPARRRARA